MARKLHRRLLLRGTLEAIDPISIGGAAAGIDVDLPMARDGEGRAYIPGTSLAGVLRAWMRGRLHRVDTDLWWGFQGPEGSDLGAASRIVVEDAPVEAARVEVWHGTGIDRRTGTVADGIKFEREVLPKGTCFPLRLSVDVEGDDTLDTARGALWHLVTALREGCVSLGAAGTRGLGRIGLGESVACLEQDWSTRAGVLTVLADPDDGPDNRSVWETAAAEVPLAPSSVLDIEIEWRPLGPLMVKAPRDGLAVDALPLVTADGDKQCMVLPGSAIKGVLRSQAERILRTVWQLDPAPNAKHLEQVDLPLVRELFGIARPSGHGREAFGRRGAIEVSSCYACAPRITAAQWNAVADAEPHDDQHPGSPLPPLLDELHLLDFQHAYHAAVDRWTGGAADQLLFSSLEPFGVAWESIYLRLDLCRLSSPGAGLALLFLVLRDLCAGGLGLGWGVNRGYGALEVTAIDINGPLPGPNPPVTRHIEVTDQKPVLDGWRDWLRCMEGTWRIWLEKQRQEATHDHDAA